MTRTRRTHFPSPPPVYRNQRPRTRSQAGTPAETDRRTPTRTGSLGHAAERALSRSPARPLTEEVRRLGRLLTQVLRPGVGMSGPGDGGASTTGAGNAQGGSGTMGGPPRACEEEEEHPHRPAEDDRREDPGGQRAADAPPPSTGCPPRPTAPDGRDGEETRTPQADAGNNDRTGRRHLTAEAEATAGGPGTSGHRRRNLTEAERAELGRQTHEAFECIDRICRQKQDRRVIEADIDQRDQEAEMARYTRHDPGQSAAGSESVYERPADADPHRGGASERRDATTAYGSTFARRLVGARNRGPHYFGRLIDVDTPANDELQWDDFDGGTGPPHGRARDETHNDTRNTMGRPDPEHRHPHHAQGSPPPPSPHRSRTSTPVRRRTAADSSAARRLQQVCADDAPGTAARPPPPLRPPTSSRRRRPPGDDRPAAAGHAGPPLPAMGEATRLVTQAELEAAVQAAYAAGQQDFAHLSRANTAGEASPRRAAPSPETRRHGHCSRPPSGNRRSKSRARYPGARRPTNERCSSGRRRVRSPSTDFAPPHLPRTGRRDGHGVSSNGERPRYRRDSGDLRHEGRGAGAAVARHRDNRYVDCPHEASAVSDRGDHRRPGRGVDPRDTRRDSPQAAGDRDWRRFGARRGEVRHRRDREDHHRASPPRARGRRSKAPERTPPDEPRDRRLPSPSPSRTPGRRDQAASSRGGRNGPTWGEE